MPRLFSTKVILHLLFILLLDWIFLPPLKNGFFQPVLLYLAVLYAGFEAHWRNTVQLALAAGFLRDALSSQPLGVETAALFAAAFALSYFVKKIDRQSLIIRLFTGFIFIFAVNLSILVLSSLLDFVHLPFGKCLNVSMSGAVSTVLFLPLFFFLSDIWFGEKSPLKQYELFR